MKIVLAICILLSLSFAGEIKVLKKEVGDISNPKESKEYMKASEESFSKKIQRKDEKNIEADNNENN